jgi:hypothetical protein
MRLCNTFLGANDCISVVHWGSPGAGRAKLRLSRGFPRGLGCGITPQRPASFDLITMCMAIDLARQRMRDAPARATRSSPSENLLGVTSSSGATLEAPAQAELRPTFAGAPTRTAYAIIVPWRLVRFIGLDQ